MNKDETNDNDKGFILTGVIVTIIIAGLWAGTYFLLKDLEETDRGTLGDMFGSINSLFSGLALAGIILTILLQRKELKLQRRELTDTRQEFKIQNETLKLQRFENTFFNLLNLHHEIVNAIDFMYYKRREQEGWTIRRRTDNEELEVVTINSRDVFRYRYMKFFEHLSKSTEDYLMVYMEHYKQAQTDFGHYFRNLYRMIKLVDETEFLLDNDNKTELDHFKIKYKYTSIIRAQISDYELLWLFYNCLSTNGEKKFKPLVERYSFFKNLPSDQLAKKEHKLNFNVRAYDPDG